MRICDLESDEIPVGLRIRSMANPNRIGTIIGIYKSDGEQEALVQWDNEHEPTGGFFENHCECEIVE